MSKLSALKLLGQENKGMDFVSQILSVDSLDVLSSVVSSLSFDSPLEKWFFNWGFAVKSGLTLSDMPFDEMMKQSKKFGQAMDELDVWQESLSQFFLSIGFRGFSKESMKAMRYNVPDMYGLESSGELAPLSTSEKRDFSLEFLSGYKEGSNKKWAKVVLLDTLPLSVIHRHPRDELKTGVSDFPTDAAQVFAGKFTEGTLKELHSLLPELGESHFVRQLHSLNANKLVSAFLSVTVMENEWKVRDSTLGAALISEMPSFDPKLARDILMSPSVRSNSKRENEALAFLDSLLLEKNVEKHRSADVFVAF